MRPTRVLAMVLTFALVQAGWTQEAAVPTRPIELAAAQDLHAAPGTYVTLLYPLVAHGGATLEIVLPDETWQTTSQGRSVPPSDLERPVPVTVRVPPFAAAGTIAPITVRAVGPSGTTAEATSFLTIERRIAIDVAIPGRIDAETRDDVPFSLTVTNRSNVRDLIRIVPDDPRLSLRRGEVELAPGEAATVEGQLAVPIEDARRRSFLVEVTVASTADATVSDTYLVQFRMPGPERFSGPPTLSARLDWTTSAGATFGADVPTRASLGTTLGPEVTGALSDFVRLGATTSDLAIGTNGVRAPRSLQLALTGERWSLASSAGADGLGASFRATTDRFGVRVGLSSDLTSRLEASTVFDLRGDLPDLRLSARVLESEEVRAHEVVVRYQLPIDLVSVALAAGVTGGSTAEDPTYRATPVVQQSLYWGSQRVYLAQQLQATPFDGRWDVGVTAGTRSAVPLGGRLSARLSLDGAISTISAGAGVTAAPFDDLRVRGDVAYQTRNGEEPFQLLRTGAGVSLSGRLAVAHVGASADYRRVDVLAGVADSAEAYGGAIRLAAGPFELDATVDVERSRAADSGEPSDRLVAGASAAFRPTFTTTLVADAGYALDRVTGTPTLDYGFSWEQRWARGLASRLAFDHDDRGDANGGVDDRLGFELDWERAFGVESTSFALAYDVRFPGGVGAPTGAAIHSVSASYTMELGTDLRTPDPLVQLFGGRIGGTVQGLIYLDHDLDGTFTPGDEPIAGTRIVFAGDTVARSDADGRFAASVPVGRYERLLFPDLPASVTRVQPSGLVVERDTTYDLDLALAPSTSLRVTVVDDLDRDGVADDGEPRRTGVGVIAVGPVRRTAVSGVDGVAVLTGLVRGEYAVIVDPTRVPSRYEATGEATFVSSPPSTPASLVVTMAERPREVVTTFRPGDLGVFGTLDPRRPRPGDEVTIEVRVQGEPREVVFEVLDARVQLVLEGGVWRGTWTVPTDLAAGRYEGTVRATSAGTEAESDLPVTVRTP